MLNFYNWTETLIKKTKKNQNKKEEFCHNLSLQE